MRFVPNTPSQRDEMLKVIGVESLDDLLVDIPHELRVKCSLNLPESKSEMELINHMKLLSKENADIDDYVCFRGAGAYDHFIPSIVNHLYTRSEFYTAYTPYQPEVSQGTLRAIYEYQSMICALVLMDVANASMYDGASAVAEAALMSHGVTDRYEILISKGVNPLYRKVLSTYCEGPELKTREIEVREGTTDLDSLKASISDNFACFIVQYPNFLGYLEPIKKIELMVHKAGGLLVVCVDPISMGILTPPGEIGADIVVGEGQALGNHISFGGPYLGFMACKEELVRKMPGRLAGATIDTGGKRGFVLTLETREQHIRREKATSNICTNEALNALAATVYLASMGKQGIKKVAELCMQKSHYLFEKIINLPGFSAVYSSPFFKEFIVKTDYEIEKIEKILLDKKIIGGLPLGGYYPNLKDAMLFCVTEKRTKEEMDRLVAILAAI